MRFEKERDDDHRLWTVQEWVQEISERDYENLLFIAEKCYPHFLSPDVCEWEIKRACACDIAVPGFVMADNLGRELDR